MLNIKSYVVPQSSRTTMQIARESRRVKPLGNTQYSSCSLKPTNKYKTQVQADLIDENCRYYCTETGAVSAVASVDLVFKSKLGFNCYIDHNMGLYEFLTGFKSEAADGKPRKFKGTYYSNFNNEIFEYIPLTKDDLTKMDWDDAEHFQFPQLKVRGELKDIYYIKNKPYTRKKVVNNYRVKDLKKFFKEEKRFPYPLNYGYAKVRGYDPKTTSLEYALAYGLGKRIGKKPIAYLLPSFGAMGSTDWICFLLKKETHLKKILKLLDSMGLKHHYCAHKQFYKANDVNGKIHLSQKPLYGYSVVIEFEKTQNTTIIPGFVDFNTGKKDFTPRELVGALYAWVEQFGGVVCDKIPLQKAYKTKDAKVLSLDETLRKLKVNRDLRYSCKKSLNTTPTGASKGSRGLCEDQKNIKKVACFLASKGISEESAVEKAVEYREKYNPTKHKITKESKTRMVEDIKKMDRYTRRGIGLCNGSPIRSYFKKIKNGDTSKETLEMRYLFLSFEHRAKIQV